MIKVYKEMKFDELPEPMRRFAVKLEDVINEEKRLGTSPADLMNVMVNGLVNLSKAVGCDREVLTDALNTCLDRVADVPAEAFYRRVRP